MRYVPLCELIISAIFFFLQGFILCLAHTTASHESKFHKLPACLGAQRHITIYETLKRIGDAESRALDVWSVSLTGGPGHAIPNALDKILFVLVLSSTCFEPVL